MRNKALLIYSLFLSIAMLSGCSGKSAAEKSDIKTYPVKTLQQLENGTREEDKQGLLAQLNTAKANYDSKINLVRDASMVADMDGYVVDVLCKEGEMQAAGNPVVLLRSENQVITVGLSDDDVKKVQVGTKVQVKIDDSTTEGDIINIVQMADKQSGTYSAEIKLSNPYETYIFIAPLYKGGIFLCKIYFNALS